MERTRGGRRAQYDARHEGRRGRQRTQQPWHGAGVARGVTATSTQGEDDMFERFMVWASTLTYRRSVMGRVMEAGR